MKYWGEQQEQAIIKFNNLEDIKEKHILYCDIIEPAFKNLIENIYYTFNFNKTLYDYDTIKHEAITHLYEKLSKYNSDRNKKSYSYFGTIVKNWLIQQSNSYKKRVFIDEDQNDLLISDLSYNSYNDNIYQKNNIDFLFFVQKKLEDNLYNEKLNNDDKKVISILVQIINDYNKFYITNKKQLYVYIREATDLPSRKITKSLNKIKLLYKEVRFNFIED